VNHPLPPHSFRGEDFFLNFSQSEIRNANGSHVVSLNGTKYEIFVENCPYIKIFA
jgi:hypothetical protein